MEKTRFPSNKVRMAGSLETTNRHMALSTLTEIERETTSLYDELFPPTKTSARKPAPANNKVSSISPNATRSLKTRRNSSDSELESSRHSGVSSQPRASAPGKGGAASSTFGSSETVEERSDPEEQAPPSPPVISRAKSKSPSKFSFKNQTQANHPPAPPSRRTPKSELDSTEDFGKTDVTQVNTRRRPSTPHFPVEPRRSVMLTTTNLWNDRGPLPPNNFRDAYFEDMESLDFVFRTAPKGTLIRCQVQILPNMISADEFEMRVEDSPFGDEPVLVTVAKKTFAGVSYHINTLVRSTKTGNRDKLKQVGDIESNFSRKKYTLKKTMGENSGINFFDLIYGNRMIADAEPKRIDIKNLKIVEPAGGAAAARSDRRMSRRSSRRQSSIPFDLVSKKPEFDQQSQTYQLDFRGRAELPSTSNMQIIERSSNALKGGDIPPLLQLGRIEKNVFALDYSFPFSAFTAFGVALSGLTRD